MKQLLIVMVVLVAMGGFGAASVDAVTELTPITGSSNVGNFPHHDVWELKCPSGALSLEVVVSDGDLDGDTFNVLLTGVTPIEVYAKTVADWASYDKIARLSLSRSTPGAIKALLYVSRTQGFDSTLYDYEFTCVGVGGVYKSGAIVQKQNQ